jgi:thiamine-monophosphate kinase
MTKSLAAVGEDQLVRVITDLFATNSLHVGIGDDAAVGHFGPNRVVVAADAMVEDVHFTRLMCPPNSVGHKLVAVNVSDFAAMGAVPLYATLTASLPPDLQFDWVCSMLAGIADAAASWDLTVAGGDVTSSPGPILLSLSVCGYLAGSEPILRSGAHAGDT